jgi:GT2 family glycosyltransferase
MSQLDSTAAGPTVSVIILNYNGLSLLPRCLETLQQSTYSPLEIVVVDNNSTDGSLAYLRESHPGVKIIEFRENLGYSRAYNAAVPMVEGEFLVLLNFDVEVEPNWVDQAVEMLVADPNLAAVQPKLHQLQNRKSFEYSGGSGGFIDIYGYPFTRGRVFDAVELDEGQYDDAVPIFWATGAAFVTRKSAFLAAGGLDGDFFMHMEELDLCWRYWLLGWTVKAAPRGIVYHFAGAALSADRYHKMYYNHRNGLVMLIKNFNLTNLLRRLPVRWMLDWLTVWTSLLKREPKRSAAVLAAHGYVWAHLPAILAKRRKVQQTRKVADRVVQRVMLPDSVVWRYYIRNERTFSQIWAGR